MVTRLIKAGRPFVEQPARHSVNSLWAETIDAILRTSGLPGFLSNFDESEHAFDPDYDLMVEICDRYHNASPATAAEWADKLAEDLLKPRFTDRQGNQKPARSRATIVGNLFNQYLDVLLEPPAGRFVICCEQPGGGHSPKTYQFTPSAPGGGRP
jgi:hypothetical protein